MGFSLKKLVKGVTDGGSPFTTQPNAPRPASTAQAVRPAVQPHASILHDITHNPVTNITGGIAKGIVQLPLQASENFSNTFANFGNTLPGSANRAAGRQTIQQNMGGTPVLNKALKFSGATGTNKQLAGDAAQIALSTVPGLGKGAPLLAKVGVGATTGAGFGAASTAGNGGTKQDIAKSAAVGALLGGAIPAAIPVSKAAVKAATPKYAGLTGKQVIMDTQKLDTLHAALQHPTNVESQQNIINGLHQIKNDHGLDFISGTPNQRTQRISQFLEQNGEAIPQLQAKQMQPRFQPLNQGGYVQIPGGRKNAVDAANRIMKRDELVGKQPITVYHGGAGVDEITKNGAKILSPEEKLKYPSSGGGYVGLSTSADKGYAQQFSKNIAGHDRVAELQIKPDAKVLELPAGKAIDDMSADELTALSKKYDVIKSNEDNEYRILNKRAIDKGSASSLETATPGQAQSGIAKQSIGEKLGIKPLDQSGHIQIPGRGGKGERNLVGSSEGSIAPPKGLQAVEKWKAENNLPNATPADYLESEVYPKFHAAQEQMRLLNDPKYHQADGKFTPEAQKIADGISKVLNQLDMNPESYGMGRKPTPPVTSTKLVPPQPSVATTKLVSLPPEVPVVPESVSLPKPKTGIKDKQLQDLQTIHKQLVNAEADNIRPIHQFPVNPVSAKVRAAGGVSSSAYEDFPKSLVRKAGASADKVAQELGYNSEGELLDALQTEAHFKATNLTNAQLKDKALENLQAGKSQHSADYAKLQDMIKQRQDELSQYPNGKYRQVKVTGKPAKMTDAELQSLSQTPEGTAPKKTNLVTVRNEKKVLRNADAERAVVDVLKKGGSTDEALNTYMKATGTDLQTAVADVKRVAAESKLGFGGGKNPLQGTIKLPVVQAGDHGQAFLNADYVKQHETVIGQKALDSFNSLSEHDKTLLQSIEKDTVANVAKKAKDPKAFLAAEKNIRTYYDTRHAYDNALGIDVGYRQNYLRQLFAKAEQEAQATMPDQINIKNGNKNPGYKQHRQYDTLNTHVGTALERDIHGSSTNHAKLAYSEGLHQAYPDQVNTSGQLVRDATGAYRQITNRYGEGVTAQRDIADAINSRSRTPTLSKGLQRYDKANAGLKYVKLGGGAFHALTEAGNFIGQQAISGKLFTEPGASGKVLKTFFSPKTMDAEIVKFRDDGTLDKASLAGLKIMAKDILADANVKLGGKLSKYTGIQALHDATFQREIPYAKLKLFEQKTKGLDVNNPADLTKMRSISAGINDLFGGINRDIEGIKPNSFKALQRFVLATDFTESKVRTAFRSINITDNSPAAQIARQAVVGKVLLFAAVAAGGGAIGGEYQGKTPKQIAENILGKLADPSFHAGRYKVALPATHVSEFSRPITPLVHPATKGSAKGDRFAGLQHYAIGRLAAVPSEVYQLRTNKDYSGNKLYGKDYAFNGGEQISKGKTAANILSGFTPIPASQGIGVAQGKTDPRAAIANTIGLRVTNEDQYNQDATPVKITTGDTPVSLTKDKAIAYNKAVADQTAILDKQLQASTQFKNANVTDQGAMKKKLHGYITDWQQRSFASTNNIPIKKAANSSVQAVAKNTLPSNLAKGVSAKTAKTKTTKPKTTKAKGTKTAKTKSTTSRKASGGRKGSGVSNTTFAAALRKSNSASNANSKALRTLIGNARIKSGSSRKLKVAGVNLKKQSVKRTTYKMKAKVA